MRSLIFVCIVLIAALRETLACSCLGPITIESSLDREENAVFATISQVLNPNDGQTRPRYYRATADLVIKGCGLTRYSQFYIKTGANSALCGFNLNVRSRYVLFGTVTNEAIDGYVRGPQPVLSINLCQANTELTNLDQSTRLNLTHRARPVCPRPCFQSRDCWRTHGFRSTCNAGVCSRLQPPPPAPTPAPRPSLNCANCPDGYYDGCNTCFCNGLNGGPGRCTRRACSSYGRTSCRNRRPEPPTNAVNCQTCPAGYYDGCNTCSCRSDGRPGFCTLRYCFRMGTARCNRVTSDDRDTTIDPPSTIDCRTCPNGYFDGCNSCQCSSDRGTVGACTRRACPGGNIRPPSCN